jgi:hypothetical protein
LKTPPVLGADEQAEVVRLVRGGMSQRAVARKFGVSQPTVAKYLAAAAPVPAPVTPASTDTPSVDPNASAIDIARALLAGATAGLASAQANGDAALVQRHNRDAGNLAILIARLEKQADPPDLLRVSRTEIDQAISDITANFTAVCDQPLLCAACGREARMRAAQEAEREMRGRGDDAEEGDEA